MNARFNLLYEWIFCSTKTCLPYRSTQLDLPRQNLAALQSRMNCMILPYLAMLAVLWKSDMPNKLIGTQKFWYTVIVLMLRSNMYYTSENHCDPELLLLREEMILSLPNLTILSLPNLTVLTENDQWYPLSLHEPFITKIGHTYWHAMSILPSHILHFSNITSHTACLGNH